MLQQNQVLCVSTRPAYDYIWNSLPGGIDFKIIWKRMLPKSPHKQCKVLLFEIESVPRDSTLLKSFTRTDSKIESIAFSFSGTVRKAVESMRTGANDFFSLPDEIELLKKSLFRIAEREKERKRSDELRSCQKSLYDFSHMFGRSPQFIELLKVVEKVISTKLSPVLIMGETGTGKGLLARAIHYNSALPDEPFVEVNCSAIPDNLIESELFGYEKGAFTGADSTKQGLFEVAKNGTIFLDEIGHLNTSLQVKLLNVIEYKTIRRLGGIKTISIAPRIITATSVNLTKAVKENAFRKDMFYRLNTVPLTLPPLRERGDDILILAEHFLTQFASEYNLNSKKLATQTKKALLGHTWPGNIRELKNTIERLVILSDEDTIDVAMLKFDESTQEPTGTEKSSSEIVIRIGEDGISKEEVEKLLIRETLRLSGGNKSKAARKLGITRPTLINKIKRHGIEKE